MINSIDLGTARFIAEITRAIYTTIGRFDIDDNKELLFDLCLTTIINAYNYNANQSLAIGNIYGYSITITESQIHKYFPKAKKIIEK